MADVAGDIWQAFAANLAPIALVLSKALTRLPDATTPLWALIVLPVVAVGCLALVDVSRVRRYRFRRVLAALLSPKYLRHASHRLDLLLMAGNTGLFGILIGNLLVSVAAVHALTTTLLAGALGPSVPKAVDPMLVALTWAAALFLAYEFAYWLDHYLSHKIPFLWEFHKVHHSAEVLSPLTNFRVHPVDSLVFINIVAMVKGMTTGVLSFAFGGDRIDLQAWGIMSAVGIAVLLMSQMQHSHVWLPLRGWLGRLILSPAHHQIHHSVDEAHHDRNFGNTFAGFDWLFGTLFIPPRKRPKLVFGVDTQKHPTHSLREGLLDPFAAAARKATPGHRSRIP
jgi:sterol desaturase/sphingolipid hydroxylase (fatty acid hydroxylase superfamily)